MANRKILLPKFTFTYLGNPESEDRLKRAYNRIFTLARENILKRKKVEQKEVKIISINHEEEMLHLCTMRSAGAM